MTDPTELSIAEASEALRSGRLQASGLLDAYLARIARLNERLNAITVPTLERARSEAAASDARHRAGKSLGPLDGIPYTVKDNIDVAGVLTSDGLAPRGKSAAAHDAFAVSRLREAGAVLLGKVNLHEGALGATTDNAHFGRSTNPWRDGYSPGGSSGGSGVAVAARLCAFSLGTDTMGSIRLPAAYCGCVGLKQTYGIVSNRGLTPACEPFDHIGPLARSVADAALVLHALAAEDLHWQGAVATPSEWSPLPSAMTDLSGVRVGVLGAVERFDMSPDVRTGYASSLEALRRLGASVQEIEVAGFDPGAARKAGLIWIEAEAAATHELALQSHPQAYPASIRPMLDYGLRLGAVRLVRALDAVRSVAGAFRGVMRGVDVLAMPTAPQNAFAFDGAIPTTQAEFCAPANFAGLPAVSLPTGLSADGLPLSLQLVGQRFDEQRLLSIAQVVERNAEFKMQPPLAA